MIIVSIDNGKCNNIYYNQLCVTSKSHMYILISVSAIFC